MSDDEPCEETALDPMNTHQVRYSPLFGYIAIENYRENEHVLLSATEALTLHKWLTEQVSNLQHMEQEVAG